MLVYLFATFLTLLLILGYERRRNLRILFVLAALPLLIVSVVRWNTGTDFRETYLPLYRALEYRHGVATLPVDEEPAFRRFVKRQDYGKTPQRILKHFDKILDRIEPVHRTLMELALRTGMGYRGVQAFYAVLIAGCVFCAIFKFSRWPSLAAFLYVANGSFFLGLNIMRQYAAVGVAILALQFILERKPFHFVGALLLASAIHFSALVFLPALLLAYWDLTPRRSLVLMLGAVALSFVAAPVLQFLLQTLGFGSYARYFKERHLWTEFEGMFLAINLCYLAIGAWYWSRACERSSYFKLWYGLTVLGTGALLFSGSVPLMKRVNYYYAAPQFLLLPEVLLAEENVKWRRLLTVVVVVVFGLETWISVCILNKNGVLPYRWRA